jgi:hypothetical protein
MAVDWRVGCSFGSTGCTSCEPSDLSSPELSDVRDSPSYSGRLRVRIAAPEGFWHGLIYSVY